MLNATRECNAVRRMTASEGMDRNADNALYLRAMLARHPLAGSRSEARLQSPRRGEMARARTRREDQVDATLYMHHILSDLACFEPQT